MPYKPKCICSYPGCGTLTNSSYCAKHTPIRSHAHDRVRPSSSSRGYGRQWRKIRERVLLAAGIPKEQHGLYAVDHNPPYDREREPDHTRYNLVPRLISEHNRKTASEDTPRDKHGRFKKKVNISPTLRQTQRAEVIIYFGPPCSGKNYLINLHKEPGDIIIDRDLIRFQLTGIEGHGSPAGYYNKIDERFWNQIIIHGKKNCVVRLPIASIKVLEKCMKLYLVEIVPVVPSQIETLRNLYADTERISNRAEWEKIIKDWYRWWFLEGEDQLSRMEGITQ